MTSTLDSISEQLARIEAALADGAAVPVRVVDQPGLRDHGYPACGGSGGDDGGLLSVWVGGRTRVIRPDDLDQWLAARERAGA